MEAICMRKALLILDAQKGFFKHADLDKEYKVIKKMIEIFNENNDLILGTKHIDENPDSIIYSNSENSKLDNHILKSCDKVFEKTVPSVFSNTNFTNFLKDESLTDLIICGFNTEYCGLFNAIVSNDRGFKTTYIEDAIGTVNNDETYEMPGLDINDFVSTVLHWSGVIDVVNFEEFIK
ncbi:cysteine hydrolase [Senegalia massiliensis]|uniref:Cysteine hydrolase n=2 Tax=Senegalia massiliensis TaxID=1720316 RepID=A0A845QUL7_9CLOT|nr:cysteine hydrolase [Senegalia massiliensis]